MKTIFKILTVFCLIAAMRAFAVNQGSVQVDLNSLFIVNPPNIWAYWAQFDPAFSNAVVAVSPPAGVSGAKLTAATNTIYLFTFAQLLASSTNDAAGVAATLTASHSTNDPSGAASSAVAAEVTARNAAIAAVSTNDAAGSAKNATNGYVWGSLYDGTGAAAAAALAGSTNDPNGAAKNATNGLPSGAFTVVGNVAVLSSNTAAGMAQANSNAVIAMAGQAVAGSNYLTSSPTNFSTIATGSLQVTNPIVMSTNSYNLTVTLGPNCVSYQVLTNATRSQNDFFIRFVYASSTTVSATNFTVSGFTGFLNPVRPKFFNVTGSDINTANQAGNGTGGWRVPWNSCTTTSFSFCQNVAIAALNNTTNDVEFFIIGAN
jgi:hypothetical protein